MHVFLHTRTMVSPQCQVSFQLVSSVRTMHQRSKS